MLVLGISGGLDLIHETVFGLPVHGLSHDAAAVLLEDGEIVAAIEEERLTRIKHTNRFPFRAIAHCLDQRGATLGDVDFISFYLNEAWLTSFFQNIFIASDLSYEAMTPAERASTIREKIAHRLQSQFGVDITNKLRFVDHHVAHAMSTYAFSARNESLVAVFDGAGESTAGLIAEARAGSLKKLHEISTSNSLGIFYLSTINYLGFRIFDEYKVMGLAPYGDPSRYRSVFEGFYALEADGVFTLQPSMARTTQLLECGPARKRDQPVAQHHMDMAASLQESLEKLVLHSLEHFQSKTRQRHLCLAGGVAHNCTMNGKILSSGLFDSVFVQPAAHDAGAALGAAMQTHLDEGGKFQARPLRSLYLGTKSTKEEIEELLEAWSDLVAFEQCPRIDRTVAELLAADQVVGWCQGRSEFGPRALGNRSIIADPRRAHNKERINAMVKKREAFRPFAPSVMIEHAREFFDYPDSVEALPYMIFVVGVRPDMRSRLGAVTHVDGSARIQTVSKLDNPRYWSVINEFRELTGVPVVLNTSFNNNVEPIVESPEDALVCYLTTGLDCLAVGDFLVTRKPVKDSVLQGLVASLPPFISLHRSILPMNGEVFEIGYTYDRERRVPCSEQVFRFLGSVDGVSSVADVLDSIGSSRDLHPTFYSEIKELWTNRHLRLRPANAKG